MKYIDTDIAYEMFLHGQSIKDVIMADSQKEKTDMSEKEKNMKVHCEKCKYLKKIGSKHYCLLYNNVIANNIDINYCPKGVIKNDKRAVRQ